VVIHSVQDPQTFGAGMVYPALMGDRNYEDSKRKSAATRGGLKRRKESGKPVGPIPLGYEVGKEIVDNKVISMRVVDAARALTIERIFDSIEAGATTGDVTRMLNADTPRGVAARTSAHVRRNSTH
jgi:hypothetical protein